MSRGPDQIPGCVLHGAEWVLPVVSPPVPNGAVLEGGGRILAVGKFAALKRDLPQGTKILDHGQAAILPGLVNAHTHLDLSALGGAIAFPRTGFPDWLGAFFPLRAELTQAQVRGGITRGMRESLDSGTIFSGDVTNGPSLDPDLPEGFSERHIFLELLGFNCDSVAEAVPAGINLDNNRRPVSKTAHSAYSVSPAVIVEAKEFARAQQMPFSIHVAEHPEEIEFLQTGGGFCRDLLQQLGRWDPKWKVPGKSPVRYLDGLGTLDGGTLLVHAVHVSDDDLEVAAQKGCSVCFCPRSNRNLSVGRPDIERALSFGIPACLGTDSLASNSDLNLFKEAGFVLDEYPGIRPEAVLEMIAAIPARTLGRGADFGALKPGLVAEMLVVSIDSGLVARNIAETVIRFGEKGVFKWVKTPAKS